MEELLDFCVSESFLEIDNIMLSSGSPKKTYKFVIYLLIVSNSHKYMGVNGKALQLHACSDAVRVSGST